MSLSGLHVYFHKYEENTRAYHILDTTIAEVESTTAAEGKR